MTVLTPHIAAINQKPRRIYPPIAHWVPRIHRIHKRLNGLKRRNLPRSAIHLPSVQTVRSACPHFGNGKIIVGKNCIKLATAKTTIVRASIVPNGVIVGQSTNICCSNNAITRILTANRRHQIDIIHATQNITSRKTRCLNIQNQLQIAAILTVHITYTSAKSVHANEIY